jgi:hypothetical protein
MGFSVDPWDPIDEPKLRPGRDYTPSREEGQYKPSINVHSNHSNLEGRYDPRAHLKNALLLGNERDEPAGRRPQILAVLKLVVILAVAAALWTVVAGLLVGVLVMALGLVLLYQAERQVPRAVKPNRVGLVFVGLMLLAIVIRMH